MKSGQARKTYYALVQGNSTSLRQGEGTIDTPLYVGDDGRVSISPDGLRGEVKMKEAKTKWELIASSVSTLTFSVA